MTQEGKAKINIWRKMYTINRYFSGLLLFKMIIRESSLDSNTTVTSLRTQLSNLDKYMVMCRYNIIKFCARVQLLLGGIQAQGELVLDTFVNVTK